MRNKFLFFLILVFSLDLFSFEDGFATNQEIGAIRNNVKLRAAAHEK